MLVAVIAAALYTAAAFNVDTRHPVIFRGPATAGDSYFGYAVALSVSGGRPWLLVGAPRANSTLGVHDELREPGALFRCPALAAGRCEEVLVDAAGNGRAPGSSYADLRDQGWLGGALDAEPTDGGRMVVCAPRWRNQRYGGHYLGNGACYVGGSGAADDGFEKLVPLAERDKQYTHLVGINAYLYSYGQAGVAAHLADGGGEVLLGAPGVFDWTGSVARYAAPGAATAERPLVPDPSTFLDLMDRYDYFGYALSSGRFLAGGETAYLVGAPRAAAGRGKAYLLQMSAGEQLPYRFLAERVGDVVGDYFGAAVLAVDVDGDGLSDALVGAPLATTAGGRFEEGRVLVYRNDGGGRLREVARLEGRAAGGRLGATLASLGDLDGDGFEDVAVAAPYEDAGRGAVYVYRGGPGDFSATPAQRIAAGDVSDALRGFGASLSRGVDVDGNARPDLAVGAYGGGAAVLLRASPVVRFVPSLTSSPERLDMDAREFQVHACLALAGGAVSEVRVDVTLAMESFRAQGVFRVGGGDAKEVNFTLVVPLEEPACRTLDVVLLPDELIDYTKPMQFSMRYAVAGSQDKQVRPVFVDTDTEKRLTDYEFGSRRRRRQIRFPDGPRPVDAFCPSCPVVDANVPNQQLTTLTVPFSVGCGSDATCQTDLRLSHSFTNLSGGAYVIGSTPTLELVLALANGAEPASLPRLTVAVPAPASLLRLPPTCHELDADSAGTTLSCAVLPHPFYNSSSYRLPLAFDMHAVTADERALTFRVAAESAGVELEPADNAANITLPLVSHADVEIRGKARDPLLLLGSDDDEPGGSTAPQFEFVQHTYQVSKYLPTPVRAVNISFLVPVAVVGADGAPVAVAQVYPPAAYFNSQPLTCAIRDGEFVLSSRGAAEAGGAANPLDFSDLQAAASTQTGQTAGTAGRERRSAPAPVPGPAAVASNGSALLIDCAPGAATRCALITCQTVALLETSDRVTVTLELRVELAALAALGASRVLLTTAGSARIAGDAGVPAALNRRPDRAWATTELLAAALAPQEVPIWIVVVAVLGALLLLALIAQGLHLAGFFKRRKRDELVQEQEEQHVQEVKESFGNMFIVPGPPGGPAK